MKRLWVLWSLCICTTAVSLETIYVTNFSNSTIYRVDPITGMSAPVATIPGAGVAGIGLATPTIAYTAGFNDGNIYRVHLETGNFEKITTTPIVGRPNDLALANSELAYVALLNGQSVASVDLTTGAHETVVTFTSPPLPLLPYPSSITVRDNTGYVVGFDSQALFVVDLTNGDYTTLPIPGLLDIGGVAVWGNTAYVINDSGHFVSVDLTTGDVTDLATYGPNFFDLAIVEDGTIAYTNLYTANKVYAIDLQNYSISAVTPVAVPGPLGGLSNIAVFAPFLIPTAGLSGNILRYTEYVNANAPSSTLDLFNTLTGQTLIDALKTAMPARLGFATFAAQNGYLASMQTVTDHLFQKRFFAPMGQETRETSMNLHERDLLASTRLERRLDDCCEDPCDKEPFSTFWLGAFGEYAHENAQRQTPAFNISLGGAVIGYDYNCIDGNVIGVGASYAYTRLHEAEHMGDASVNQGFFGFYSLLNAGNVYFDLGVWGGYYHTHNQRKISFPSYEETAKSKTHGWQAAPHVEVGYYANGSCDWFGASPFILGDWVATWQHEFTEHGAEGLNVHQKGQFSALFRGEVGLRFYQILTSGRGELILQEKGSYAYQKMTHTGTVTAFLVGSPGSFTVSTLVDALNLGVAEFSALFKPFDRSAPYLALRYQGEFGSGYMSHQGIVEIGKDF